MQISAATMLATQNTTASRPADPAAEFAPLLFKKAAPAPVQTTASAAPEAAAIKPATAFAGASNGSGPGGGYVRPGSQIDIKV